MPLRGAYSGVSTRGTSIDWLRTYLTESVYEVVLQTSIPAQIRQFILYISNNQGLIDEFVRESPFAERLSKHFMRDKYGREGALRRAVEEPTHHITGLRWGRFLMSEVPLYGHRGLQAALRSESAASPLITDY